MFNSLVHFKGCFVDIENNKLSYIVLSWRPYSSGWKYSHIWFEVFIRYRLRQKAITNALYRSIISSAQICCKRQPLLQPSNASLSPWVSISASCTASCVRKGSSSSFTSYAMLAALLQKFSWSFSIIVSLVLNHKKATCHYDLA